ncbi:GNAT family N-acetyltransferase [Candidatus Woesearchaeota archaeon]|jgi:ribosomal protein S18 acetylase RimI-like enzyme|nr:GNAT family N-acetyltransferase [Candidatus Woesearchaeota archaeon]MBT6044870.1 GNAT family N-acetyltransferase [Candidatus Woesearchaeota archaeon]
MIKDRAKLITDRREVQAVYDFVRQFPLDYPGYFEWLKKCEGQLLSGDKEAVYMVDGQQVVGSIIFQRHREESSVLEIKNLRVDPRYARKGIGKALERRVDLFARSGEFRRIQVDAHRDNFEVVNFFIGRGYNIDSEETLYVPDKLEVVMVKDL